MNTGFHTRNCDKTICNNTRGWKKADFSGRLTTQSKSLPRVSNYCGKKKSSYIIRRILPILNPVLMVLHQLHRHTLSGMLQSTKMGKRP